MAPYEAYGLTDIARYVTETQLHPRFWSQQMASNGVMSNVCQALPLPPRSISSAGLAPRNN
jgi:hypothetical protein